jgi:hypothetical protein
MKNKWKTIKLGLALFALPLVATAAASVHQWIAESNPMTCQQDSGFVGEQVNYAGTESYVDPGYAPIEYAGESIGCGCASGGCCGAVSDYSGYSSCGGSCGGGYGAGGGGSAAGVGGRGLGRLLAIAGLTVGIIALADNGDGGQDPDAGTIILPN